MQSETLSTLFHGHFELPAGITYGQMSDMNENLTNGVSCGTGRNGAQTMCYTTQQCWMISMSSAIANVVNVHGND